MALYKIKTLWSGGPGGAGVSTMWFDAAGGTAAQCNSAVGTFWNAVRLVQSSTLTFTTDSIVFTVDEATGAVIGSSPVTPVTASGSAATDVLPWATQGLIQWRTGQYINGREIRGRTFIPGMLESNNASGLPMSSVQTTVNAAAAALIADANSDFQVYSLANHNAQTVTSGTMWSTWAQLRSRRS